MPASAGTTVGGAPPGERPGAAPARLRALGPMRIRKKLVILHTCFSVTLAAALLLALRPAVRALVREAELHEAALAMSLFAAAPDRVYSAPVDGVEMERGSAEDLGLLWNERQAAMQRPGSDVPARSGGDAPTLLRFLPERGEFLRVTVRSPAARDAVFEVYQLLTFALLSVYLLIALALETYLLPRQVYGPIERMLRADDAVQAGRRDDEIIAEGQIPSDEIGSIMRSRNESILKLRRQEAALANALDQLEVVAMELKRKNHLLETARQNLADQDRLASLGMMSAGIAHELNTPLAVLKGQVERINERPSVGLPPEQAALMLRVVKRLEKLSESLLDFARVRPPAREPVALRVLIDESWTLVSLDREAASVALENRVPEGLVCLADPDRLHQVFVNLLRNAVDAMERPGEQRNGTARGARPAPRIVVSAEESEREGQRWVSIRVSDTGPGIDPAVLPSLFEPFTSTRLDSRGTGLGLAVSEGIVREHGGVILARNSAADSETRGGAIFEVMLPMDRPMLASEHAQNMQQ